MNKNKFIFFIFTLAFLFFLYFYVAPILTKGLNVFRIRNLDLNSAKDYYTVLSSAITFLLGTLGLILGYFYYKDKRKAESLISEIERKRKRLDDLITKIDSFDQAVDDVLHHRYSSPQGLKEMRNTISRRFETIEIMLDLNKELLGLEESDVKTILRVNSFVDKNEILMHLPHNELDDIALLSVKDNYVNLIQDARRACYRKVC